MMRLDVTAFQLGGFLTAFDLDASVITRSDFLADHHRVLVVVGGCTVRVRSAIGE